MSDRTCCLINADQASTSSPKAPGVGEAMARFIERGAYNIARGTEDYREDSASVVLDTRIRLAEMFGASSPKYVTFCGGITLAINQMLYGLLRPGDHVVTSSLEHHAVGRTLTRLEQERGISFDIAQADDSGILSSASVASCLRTNTRLVLVTAASNVIGTLTPLRAIGDICERHGCLFAVDTAQLAGSDHVTLAGTGADILAYVGHKGLLGPQGVGGLILTPDAAESLEPVICGGTGSFSDRDDMPRLYPDRLEAGTLPLPAIAGLRAALTWFDSHDLSEIRQHKNRLTRGMVSGLSRIPGVRLFGPTDSEAAVKRLPVISLQCEGIDTAALGDELLRGRVYSRVGLHCAPWAHKTIGSFPEGTLRLALGVFHDEETVDELCSRVEQAIIRLRP